MTVRIYTGDCREVLATLDAESVDAVVTDPPYGFGFMGRQWDAFAPADDRRREAQRDRKGTERRSERWPWRWADGR